MSNDSEKADKTEEKVVGKFLLLLVLLVSVLFLIVETWHPELLESLTTLMIKYKQLIIVIIILLASVSLLSFLIQIYMNQDPEEIAKIWKIIAYPVHLVFRLVARAVLLLAILGTFLTPLLILVLILVKIHGIGSEWIKDPSAEIGQGQTTTTDDINVVSMIASLFASLGLFSFLVKREDFQPLWYVIEKIIKAFQGMPEMDIRKSLSGTWRCDIQRIWPSSKKTFTESLKLLPAVLILCISCYLASPPLKQIVIWSVTQTTHIWQDIVSPRVIVWDLSDFSHKPTISYLFEKGTQFSLVYPDTGKLQNKIGICPKDKNRKWLELFKKAISECSNEKRIKLKIQAFASIAPVLVNGDITKSDTLNCEIANQRAEALIYFLMLPDSISYAPEECEKALKNSRMWGRKENELCTRSAMPDTNAWKERGFDVTYETRSDTIVWKGPKFDVAYKPWKSYEEMAANKPADDGSLDNRRLDLEFLNRSVQIIIEEGDCWTKSVDKTGQSVEIPAVQRKSFEQR